MIFKIVLLILATISLFISIVGLIKGKKYAHLVENIDSSDYFLKDLYVLGFYLNDTRIFALRGKLEQDLKAESRLIWDNIYYVYYANLAWSQFLTLSILTLTLGLAVSSLFDFVGAIFFLVVTVLVIIVIWHISISKIGEAVTKRRDDCEIEFPNMVSKLSLLINSGMVLRDAWNAVAYGKSGPLYELMQKTCENMKNGMSDLEAIHKFGILSDSQEIKKFTSALIQGLEKGNSDLATFLIGQASELWAHKRQIMLQKGEIAAGKLIIPLGIMFAGIIMIIIAAAMQSMSF